MKDFREMERMVKGFANHRRVQILALLNRQEDLSLSEIAERVKVNLKTAGEHVRRLVLSGLVWKYNDYHHVRHKLSTRGKEVLKFLRILE